MPERDLIQATELNSRMMRVAEYHFSDDPEVTAELASIRAGTGYLDLASDLPRLATLFESNADILKSDRKWYRPTDVTNARAAAATIIQHLGLKDANDWTDISVRLWTLLRDVYEDVRETGQFLFRREPMKDQFPSLYAATRTRATRKEVEEAIESESTPPATAQPETAPVGP